MTAMDMSLKTKLREVLIKHEGWKNFPYLDTVGKTTIGVGFNLSDRGLPDAVISQLLDSDMEYFNQKLTETFSWYAQLSMPRKVVLASVAFNLGLKGLMGFKKMLDAMAKKDYAEAARQLLDSKAASQTGTRYNDLARILEKGEFV
jgi:lysozyme